MARVDAGAFVAYAFVAYAGANVSPASRSYGAVDVALVADTK